MSNINLPNDFKGFDLTPKQNVSPINTKYINPLTNEPNKGLLLLGTQLPGSSLQEQQNLMGRINTYMQPGEAEALFPYYQNHILNKGTGVFEHYALGGALQSLASTVDFFESFGKLNFMNEGLSNTLYNLGNKVIKNSPKLYQKHPRKVDPTDPAWWFNQIGQGAGMVVGIAAETGLETALVSLATDGLGLSEIPEIIASKAKTFLNIAEDSPKILKLLTKTDKAKRMATTWGVFKRYTESLMEGKQTYDETRRRFIKEGFDRTTASAMASRAASTTFWGQMPLAILDIIGARTLMVNPVSGESEGIIESLIGKIGTKAGRIGTQATIEAISEGNEEFYQNIVQDYSKYKAYTTAGIPTKPFSLGNELVNADNWNAFIGGAIGGLFMLGPGSAMRKFNEYRTNKYYDGQAEMFKNNMIKNRIDLITAIKNDEKQNNFKGARNKRRVLNIQMAISALHLDNLSNERTTSFETNRSMISDSIEKLKEKDGETYKELGIENDKQAENTISDFEQYLKDIDEIKNIYNKNKSNIQSQSLTNVVYFKFVKDLLKKQIDNYNSNIETTLDKMSDDPSVKNILREEAKFNALTEELEENRKSVFNIKRKRENLKLKSKDKNKTKEAFKDEIDKERGKDKKIPSETEDSLKEDLRYKLKKQNKLKKDLNKQQKLIKELRNNETNKNAYSIIDDFQSDNDKLELQNDLINNIRNRHVLEHDYNDVSEQHSKWSDTDHQIQVVRETKERIKNNQKLIKKLKKLEKRKTKEPSLKNITEKGGYEESKESNGDLNNPTIVKDDNIEPTESNTEDRNLEDLDNQFNDTSDISEKPEIEKNNKEKQEELSLKLKNIDSQIAKLQIEQIVQLKKIEELAPINRVIRNEKNTSESQSKYITLRREQKDKISEITKKIENIDNKLSKLDNTDETIKEIDNLNNQKENLTKDINKINSDYEEKLSKIGIYEDDKKYIYDTTELMKKFDNEINKLKKQKEDLQKEFNKDTNEEIPTNGIINNLFDSKLNFSPNTLRDESVRIYRAKMLKSMIDYLKYKLNKQDITFKDLMYELKKVKSYDELNRDFKSYVLAWIDNKYPQTDFEKIYDELFNPLAAMADAFSEASNTKEFIENNIPESKQQKENENIENDNSKKGIKVITSDLKAHFYFVDKNTGKRIQSTDTSPEKCVDYDYMKPGKVFSIKRPDNYKDIIITYYDENNNKISMAYGKFLKVNNIDENSDKGIAYMPLVAVDTETGEQIFLIHNESWYNSNNIGYENNNIERINTINNAKANLRALRKLSIEKINNNEEHKIEITNVSGVGIYYNSVSKTERKNLPSIFKEAPHSQISTFVENNNEGYIILDGKKRIINNSGTEIRESPLSLPGVPTENNNEGPKTYNTVFNDDKIIIQSNIKLHNGDPLDIRFIGYNEINGEQYKIYRIFLPIIPIENTNDKITSSVENSLISYVSGKSDITNQIEKETGLDLTDKEDLHDYLRSMTLVVNPISTATNINKKRLELINLARSKYGTYNSKVVIIIQMGNEFILTTNESNAPFISITSNNDKTTIDKIHTFFKDNKKNILVSLDNTKLIRFHNKNFPFIIQKEDEMSIDNTSSLNEEFQKHFLTRVNSYNIGTEQNPKYVTRVQPIIKFKSLNEEEYNKYLENKTGTTNTDITNIDKKNKEFLSKLSNKEKETTTNNSNANIEIANVETQFNKEDVSNEEKQPVINENNNLSDETKALLKTLSNIDLDNNTDEINIEESFEPKSINDEELNKVLNNSTRIKNLSIGETLSIISFIENRLIQNHFNINQYYSEKEIDNLKLEFNDFFGANMENITNTISNINNAINIDGDKLDEAVLNKLKAYKHKLTKDYKKLKSVQSEWDSFKKEALSNLKSTLGLTIKEEEELDTEETIDESYGGQGEESVDEENVGRVKELGKSSIEENQKLRLPFVVKRLLKGIPIRDKEGNIQKTHLGLPDYYDLDTIYDKLMEVLLYDEDIQPSIDYVFNKLRELSKDNDWIKDVLNKLENADIYSQAQFVLNATKHFASMKSPKLSRNFKKNTYSLRLFDTNSSEIKRKIVMNWNMSHISSDLYEIRNGKLFLNNEILDNLISRIMDITVNMLQKNPIKVNDKSNLSKLLNKLYNNRNGIQIKQGEFAFLDDILNKLSVNEAYTKYNFALEDKGNYYIYKDSNNKFYINKQKYVQETADELTYTKATQELLKDLGISLSDETISELSKVGLRVFTSKNYKNYNLPLLNSMGMTSKVNPFGKIFKTIIDYKNNIDNYKSGLNVEDIMSISDIMSSDAFKIAAVESKFTDTVGSTVIYDNGKNLYLITLPKYATDKTNDLKTNGNYRNTLINFPLTSQNLILKQLIENPKFRDIFKIHHTPVTVLEELGRKSFGDSSITSLGEMDYDIVNLTLLQDIRSSKNIEGKMFNIKLRHLRTLFPTMSDKTQEFILETIGFKFTNNEITSIGNVVTDLSDNTLELLYNQLFEPEYHRINSAFHDNNDTNTNGYDNGKYLFLTRPELNFLLIDGKHIQDIIKSSSNKEEFEKIAKTEIKNKLKSIYINLINDKIAEWEQFGLLGKDKNGNTQINYMDSGYLNALGYKKNLSDRELFNIATADFILNNAINLNNIVQLYNGDLAFYVKDSKFNSDNFETDENEKVIPYKYKNREVLDNIIDEANTIASKRAAFLAAPGIKQLNSNNERYIQIMLQDETTNANNLDYLIDLHYGKEESEKAKHELDTLNIINDEITKFNSGNSNRSSTDIDLFKKEKQNILDSLQKSYPIIKNFINIESTDGSEIVTVKEGLNNLLNNGKITPSLYKVLIDKVKLQRKVEKEGKPLPENSLITEEEFSKMGYRNVAQPTKPVYAGEKLEPNLGRVRPIYIKTSSIILFPQSTQGKQINKLRLLMEQLEENEGLNVRASYDSGNKVGGIKNTVQIFNPDRTIKNLTYRDLKNSSMVLDRKGFKIQQELPFKAGKQKPNTISLATQIMKLLFGNDVENLNFNYKGNQISGLELKNKYNTFFNNLVSTKLDLLYSELGINDKENINKTVVAKNLLNLIIKEAKARNLYYEDLKQLGFKVVKDEKGNHIEFDMPLWMLNNTDKFESLAISLVKNQLIKLKLPGYSYVATSASGWNSDNESNYKGRIIYTNKYDFNKGELQEQHLTSNGKLQKTQVFVPARFKDANNNLINLEELDSHGNPIYYDITPNGLVLKEGIIDDSLLNLFTLRIPTSSHALTSSIEIAGFMPSENGDLIVIPNNIMPQKGLDFDFDKEFAYIYHYSTDEHKISKLNPGISIDKLEEVISKAHHDYKIINSSLDRKDNHILQSEIQNKQSELDFYKEEKILTKKEYKSYIEELKNLRNLTKLSRTDKIDLLKKKKLQIVELQKLYNKLLENEIITIHNTVLSSPNNKLQKKVAKVLSIKFAKDQSILIDNQIQSVSKKSKSFIDYNYQRDTMNRGSSSKMAIGVYAQSITFLSQNQQLEKGKQVTINKSNLPIFIESNGNHIESDGIIGRINTIDGNRSIAEQLDERGNTAVDDMKENILGKVNINETTINIDSLLSLLGIDKGKTSLKESYGSDTVNISYLFLSQPILREFAKLYKRTNSKVAPVYDNREQEVIRLLEDKYGKINPDFYKNKNVFNIDKLVKNLTKPDNNTQLEILVSFLKLKNAASELSNVQHVLNLQKRFSKNMFNIIDIKDYLRDYYEAPALFPNENNLVTNSINLLGTYIPFTNIESDVVMQAYLRNGYIPLTYGIVKPDNPVSAMLLKSLNAIETIFSEHYIQFDDTINAGIDTIIQHSSSANNYNKQKLKSLLFKELTKYAYISKSAELFNRNVKEERFRLLADTESNMSLPTFIQLLINNNHPIIKNQILRRLSTELHNDGKYSILKFTNTNNGMLYEQGLYKALYELMENNTPLPDYNYENSIYKKVNDERFGNLIDKNINTLLLDNKIDYFDKDNIITFKHNGKAYKVIYKGLKTKEELKNSNLGEYNNSKHKYVIERFYTSKDLANDLILYNFITNPLQEAIQFSKYITLPYFKLTNTVANLRGFNPNSNKHSIQKLLDNNFILDLRNKKISTVSQFEIQFYQHKPEMAPKFKNLKEATEIANNALKSNKSNLFKPFIAKYEKNNDNPVNFKLYIWVNGKYKEIPIVGNYAVNEYDDTEGIITPFRYEIENQNAISDSNNKKEIKKELDKDSLEQTAKEGSSKNLLNYLSNKGLENNSLNLLISNIVNRIDKDFRLRVTNNNEYNAVYNHDTNEISINKDILKFKNDDLANIVLHEYIHGLTVNEIKKHLIVINNKITLSQDAPKELKDVFEIYNKLKDTFKTNEDYISMMKKLDILHDNNISNTEKENITLTEKEKLYYPLRDIYEFITGTFTNENFQTLLKNQEYDNNNNLLSKFVDSLLKLLEKTGLFQNDKGLLKETVRRNLLYIDKINSKYTKILNVEDNPSENLNVNMGISQLDKNKKGYYIVKLPMKLGYRHKYAKIVSIPDSDIKLAIYRDKYRNESTGMEELRYFISDYKTGILLTNKTFESEEEASKRGIEVVSKNKELVTKSLSKFQIINNNSKFSNTFSNVVTAVSNILNNNLDIHLENNNPHAEYYVDSDGNRYKRVTHVIHGNREENNKIDENNPNFISSTHLGTKVDELLRNLFSGYNIKPEDYNFTSKEILQKFISQIKDTDLYKRIRNGDLFVIPKEVTLHINQNGDRVAGTTDIVIYDKNGNIEIIDIKTMKGNNFIEKYYNDNTVKYDTEVYGMSKREAHTKQLNMYNIMLNNTYGVKASKLTILAIELKYNPGELKTKVLNLLKFEPVTIVTKVDNFSLKDNLNEPKIIINKLGTLDPRDALKELGFSEDEISQGEDLIKKCK